MEIERKFLVNREIWEKENKPDGTPYRQGYLTRDPQRAVRVRWTPDAAFLTLKGESKGPVRAEFEYPIPPDDALYMLAHMAEAIVFKRRFVIYFKGEKWEVDEFSGQNEGLILAEIELNSTDEIFERPPWLGAEVTEDERYYNLYLAWHPFNTWAPTPSET